MPCCIPFLFPEQVPYLWCLIPCKVLPPRIHTLFPNLTWSHMLQHEVLHVLNFWASFCDLYSRESAVESCSREGLRVNLLLPKGMSVTPVPGLFIQITASKKFLPYYRERYYNTWRPENIQPFKCAVLYLSDRCLYLIARALALTLCLASAGKSLPELLSLFVH